MEIRPLQPFGALIKISNLDEISPSTIQALLDEKKLVLIRGLEPLSRGKFLNFILSLTPENKDIKQRLLHWEFGPVMELKQSESIQNYLFSNEKVPFHWDGAFHQEPSYLAFNCIQAPNKNSGGETLFSLTERIYDDLSTTEKGELHQVQLTYKTEKKAHYGGDVTVSLVQRHPKTGRPILRFAEPVKTELNPVNMEVLGLPETRVSQFISSMTQKVYQDNYCYQHQWETGDLLLVDNFSAIHGRKSFLKQSPRHIRRIQIL